MIDWLVGWLVGSSKKRMSFMVMVEFGDGRFFVCGDFRYSKIGREEDWKKRTGDGSSDEDLDRGLPQKSPGFPLIPFPLRFPAKA